MRVMRSTKARSGGLSSSMNVLMTMPWRVTRSTSRNVSLAARTLMPPKESGHSHCSRPPWKYAVGWPSVTMIMCRLRAGCRARSRAPSRSPSWRLVNGSPMFQLASGSSASLSSTARV
jgi:hypothetical protein